MTTKSKIVMGMENGVFFSVCAGTGDISNLTLFQMWGIRESINSAILGELNETSN